MIGYLTGLMARIKYKPGWWLERKQDGNIVFIRWAFKAPCTLTGELRPQYGRWWPVFGDADPDSTVKTAYIAALQCEAHECAEFFKLDGALVFDPHKVIA